MKVFGREMECCGTETLPRWELRHGNLWVVLAWHPPGTYAGGSDGKWGASVGLPEPDEGVICRAEGDGPEQALRALEANTQRWMEGLVDLLGSELTGPSWAATG